jgi:hypothetical protein
MALVERRTIANWRHVPGANGSFVARSAMNARTSSTDSRGQP